jgi:NADH-quinone oxidoreductase subunit J
MPFQLLSFYVLAAVILGAAVLVVTRRNAITAALFLALTLVGVAGLYVLQRAEFLFAVQVLVYTGGVMVLFLFVIMLVDIEAVARLRPTVRRWWLKVATTAFSFAVLGYFARGGALAPAAAEPDRGLGNVELVAGALLTDYLLIFELTSVFLLVAMIGAIVLARKES